MENQKSVLDKNLHTGRNRLKPAHIIVFGFLSVILLGSFFLSLPISSKSREWTPYLSSIFTATSAVCVTGLIALPTAVHFSVFGQVVILLLIQIGGLGFMTLTTMVLMLLRRKITLKDRLVMQEALNQDNAKGVVRLTRNILFLTLFIEFIGFLIFLPVFTLQNGAIGVWQAVFTSISAFCNAGFDLFGTAANGGFVGLTGFVSNPIVSLGVCAMIILGGLGFTVIMDVTRNRFRFSKYSVHTKVVLITTMSLILFGFFLFFINEYSNPLTMGNLPWYDKLLASFFQSITCRTAGFNTVDQQGLTAASKLVSMFLMFVGASPGSTGGGIKNTTLAVIILMVIAGIKKDEGVVVSKHSINHKNTYRAVSIFLLSLTLAITLGFVLLMSEKNTIPAELYSFENCLFEAFSAFGTVGLSAGITPYLSPVGKIAVMLVMFFGRVGPITIGLLFMTRANKESIKYPEGTIMLG